MIIINPGNCLGNIAGQYAFRVLKDLEVKEPPVVEAQVLEYFGLNLKQVDYTEEQYLNSIVGTTMDTPAFLFRGDEKNLVVVRGSDSHERKRLSIFHECGHFDLPWHEGADYLCQTDDMDLLRIKALEREAFDYASSMLFPSFLFFNDMHSLPSSLYTIEILAERYCSSFEATAIRYTQCSPDMCATVYIQPNKEDDLSRFPYQVRYSVISPTFHRYWKKGDKIGFNELINSCFVYNPRIKGEIPASVFGSEKKHHYQAELKMYGREQVCAFLSIPSRQGKLL